MNDFKCEGVTLRLKIKELVFNFMKNAAECLPNCGGLKQAEIFHECGLDWGTYENTTSSNQQYWVVGLLRDLEKDGLVQRDIITKKWRLK